MKPRAKPRPRITKRGYAYTPKTYQEYEKEFASYYKGPMFEGTVSINLTIKPKKMIVYITELEAEESKVRGDLDNIAKGVLDALNEIAYPDDKWVQKLLIRKQ